MAGRYFTPEHEIDRCSLCGTCTYVCPVFLETRQEGHTARGHMQLIDAFLLSGGIEAGPDGTVALGAAAPAITPAFEGMLDCCLRCYRCMDVCPSNIHTVSVFEEGRAEITRRKLLPRISDWITAQILPSRMLIHFAARSLWLAQQIWGIFWHPSRVADKSNKSKYTADLRIGARAVKSNSEPSERFKTPSEDAFWFLGQIAIPKIAGKFFIGSAFARKRAPKQEPALIAAASTPAGAVRVGAAAVPSRRPRVAYLVDCMTDTLYPAVARDTVAVLEAAGFEVVIPEDAGCCGAPVLGTGDMAAFERMARATRERFTSLGCEYIVASNPTCAKTMKMIYPEKFGAEFVEFSKKIKMDFEVMKLAGDKLKLDAAEGAIGFHDPCHQKFALKITREPREMLGRAAAYTPRAGEDACCGFGGTFCVDFPKLAQKIADKKGDFLAAAPEEEIATTCPACLYYLNQHSAAHGGKHRSVHLSEVVARAVR
ncbi:MAG: (Fe-S)-binding protein [bacterium]|jgi:Fe-S oxidoreductase